MTDSKDDMGNVRSIGEIIKEMMGKLGLGVVDEDEFYAGVNDLYIKPSLNEVVEEELPQIIERDALFFQRYGIELPKNLEVELFDMYYDDHGKEGLIRIYNKAKLWFRQFTFYLIDYPNRNELKYVVDKFKDILEGRYFEQG